MVLGTDGAAELLDPGDARLPGRDEPVGPFSQLWSNDRIYDNPDHLRRRLHLIARDAARPDWDGRELRPDPGLLGDDATRIFKSPDHADLAGNPLEQQAARDRLAEHQTKLRAFPKELPAAVVAPEALVTDRSGNSILGYEMRLVAAAEPLARWADPVFRRGGATQSSAAGLLRDLHATVSAIHAASAVIGDFNDLNLLVAGADLFVIDADCFQFDNYLSRVFTERFVDPMLCDPSKAAPVLVRPHTRDSDWYAFAALLCQTLLQVGPHGGVHKPRDPAKRCLQPARALRRISVFPPEVQYPKPAALVTALPDAVLHELVRIFERDGRGAFPRALLEALEFRQCPRCALEHCRPCCPRRSPHASPPAVVTAVRGQVRSTLCARTRGVFLCATRCAARTPSSPAAAKRRCCGRGATFR